MGKQSPFFIKGVQKYASYVRNAKQKKREITGGMDKLAILPQYAEMARVCGVPMTYLLKKGQQIKVVAQLLPRANQGGFLMPYIPVVPSKDKFTGATVITPKRGYYDEPLATLDFSALYPSIMMAHNLCYTTWLPEGLRDVERFGLDLVKDVTKTPNGFYFVKQHIQKGILPSILESLLSARRQAKVEMAQMEAKALELEDGGGESVESAGMGGGVGSRMERAREYRFREAVLNGRQLALKVSANSVYGFTGATIGKLPCLAISASVTAFGREMIDLTQKTIEDEFTMETMHQKYHTQEASADADIVYGDTVIWVEGV